MKKPPPVGGKPKPVGIEDVMNDPLKWRKGEGGCYFAISNYSRVKGNGTVMYIAIKQDKMFMLTLNGSQGNPLLVKGKTVGSLSACQFAAEQFDRCFCMAAMLEGKV